jgi:hypothetical protein
MRIYSNKVKCNLCEDIIESLHRRDFKTCKCGAVSVDGGKIYLRRVFREEGCFTELSQFDEEAP